MSLEETLSGWTGPSSDTEQDKQDRTKRMVQEAVAAHGPFDDCSISVYSKGSYANNTNVRTDSDVDIAVQCHEVEYWEEETSGAHPPSDRYAGIWTPDKLRSESCQPSEPSSQAKSTLTAQPRLGSIRVPPEWLLTSCRASTTATTPHPGEVVRARGYSPIQD